MSLNHEEAHALLDMILDRDPRALMIVYETKAAGGYATLPVARAVAVGLTDQLCAQIEAEAE